MDISRGVSNLAGSLEVLGIGTEGEGLLLSGMSCVQRQATHFIYTIQFIFTTILSGKLHLDPILHIRKSRLWQFNEPA